MKNRRTDVRNMTRPCFIMYGVFNNNTRTWFPERNNLQFLDFNDLEGHAIFHTEPDAKNYIRRHKLFKACRVARVLIVPLETREAIIQDPCENCKNREEIGIHERVYRSLKSKGVR